MKFATAAAMNVTNVEVDDVMSILSSGCSDGVARCDRDAGTNGLAKALADGVCDAPSDCTAVTC